MDKILLVSFIVDIFRRSNLPPEILENISLYCLISLANFRYCRHYLFFKKLFISFDRIKIISLNFRFCFIAYSL